MFIWSKDFCRSKRSFWTLVNGARWKTHISATGKWREEWFMSGDRGKETERRRWKKFLMINVSWLHERWRQQKLARQVFCISYRPLSLHSVPSIFFTMSDINCDYLRAPAQRCPVISVIGALVYNTKPIYGLSSSTYSYLNLNTKDVM